jgi:VanZ family protein
MKKKLIWWIIIIIWCIFIYSQSDKPAVDSNKESSFIVEVTNHLLDSFFGTGKIAVTSGLVRKTAHFMEYFVLGFLLYNALNFKRKLLVVLMRTVLIGAFYACTDEFHQYFIPGRAMRLFDVMIDTLGIFSSGLILHLLYKSKLDNQNKKLYN